MADTTQLRQHVSERIVEIATDALERTYRDTVEAAPLGKTGALRQLIDTTPPMLANEFVATAEIMCLASYAGYTDEGTQDGPVIEGHPLLAFYWENGPDGPGDYFYRHVFRRGSPGTQWFNSGIDGGEPMASRWRDALTAAAS